MVRLFNLLRAVFYLPFPRFPQAAASVGLMMGGTEGEDGNTWSVGKEKYHIETFDIPSSLMGLVIGTQGSNIRAARQLPGVVHIEVHEDLVDQHRNPASDSTEVQLEGSSTQSESIAHIKIIADVGFRLFFYNASGPSRIIDFTLVSLAQSAAEAKAARSILEFCEVCLLVPRRLIGRILGSKTANILAINGRSGVKHIHLEENPEHLPKQIESVSSITEDRMPAYVRVDDIHPDLASSQDKGMEGGFFLCGTRDAVDKARLLITFQIDCIFDLEKLEAEKLVLLRELPPPRGRSEGYHPPQKHYNATENGANGPSSTANRARNPGAQPAAYRVGVARSANSGAGDPYDGQVR